MSGIGRDSVGSRVRVDLRDGFNCVGTVRRVYFDSRGRRTILVEDSLGNERAVRPARPSESVEIIDDTGQGGSA
jgi:hypothetical protein